jgi:magnesium-transporting ATPase (P-type)
MNSTKYQRRKHYTEKKIQSNMHEIYEIPEEKTLHRTQKTEQHARTLLNTRGENTTQKIKDKCFLLWYLVEFLHVVLSFVFCVVFSPLVFSRVHACCSVFYFLCSVFSSGV